MSNATLKQAQSSVQQKDWHAAVKSYQQVIQMPVEGTQDEPLLRDKETAIVGLGRCYAQLKWVYLGTVHL